MSGWEEARHDRVIAKAFAYGIVVMERDAVSDVDRDEIDYLRILFAQVVPEESKRTSYLTYASLHIGPPPPSHRQDLSQEILALH